MGPVLACRIMAAIGPTAKYEVRAQTYKPEFGEHGRMRLPCILRSQSPASGGQGRSAPAVEHKNDPYSWAGTESLSR